MTITEAANLFINRKSRRTHPAGTFDNANRWYPTNEEECDCCATIRSPSRAYPYSLMVHCRTAKHIANLNDISLIDLKKEIKKIN